MTKSIFRCVACKRYTLDPEQCPICGKNVISPQPPRFSLEKEKKYSKYRRELLKQQVKKASQS